tara:strand:- start:93 stop:395 length:303 start_codon:yes stop_codon:yes gene_type:complete
MAKKSESVSNWHHEDIKAEIRKRGSTLKEIGIKAGLHPSALGHSLYYPVPAANRAIADFFGLNVQDIWPGWFDADGEVRRNWRDSITGEPVRQRQKALSA